MILSILNSAPASNEQSYWGDSHFGLALFDAISARGVKVQHHYWPWESSECSFQGEVSLVLRGRHAFVPNKGGTAVLWLLSHPADVTREEIESYDLVYTSSETHWSLLRSVCRTRVELLRQCTDVRRFQFPSRPLDEDLAVRADIVYVASSHATRRDMALWAVESGEPFRLFGRYWDKVGYGHLVEREYVENEKLPALYQSARLSLNDHWADMKNFGFINNRVFDCLASGLPVLSDSFPELREVLGDGILYANSASEFREAIKRYKTRYPEVLEKAHRKWEEIGANFTFDARVDQILSDIHSPVIHSRPLPLSQQDIERLESTIRENAAQQMQRTRDIEASVRAHERELKRRVEKLEKELQQARRLMSPLLRLGLFIVRLYRGLVRRIGRPASN